MPHNLVGNILVVTQHSTAAFGLRAFASGVSLMIIATLRWPDAQLVTEIDKKKDFVVFSVLQREKSNAQPFYRDDHLEDITNSPKWIAPLFRARAEYAAIGSKPRFTFFRCDEIWVLDMPRPTKYAAASSFFRRLTKLWGYGDKFLLRIPSAFLPTWADQLGWRKEGHADLGRWGPNSEMPNWYGRAARNAELRLRNEIIQKVQQWRKPAGAFELPKRRRPTELDGDLSSVDSASDVTSSGGEVNIDDLDDTDSGISGYTPYV